MYLWLFKSKEVLSLLLINLWKWFNEFRVQLPLLKVSFIRIRFFRLKSLEKE